MRFTGSQTRRLRNVFVSTATAMDVTGTATSTAAACSSSSPAPFLLKTYDMIDDPSTDPTVSWSPSGTSFVVWDPADLAARLLPSFFKHCNFSSFIRQLNTYGFHKIHPERWEFANDDFARGRRHLLKNIHRRKPVHSHSHPLGHERAELEEEIDRLAREKAAIQADLLRFQRRQPLISSQIDAVDRRLCDMERRQEKMVAFVRRAVQNPDFVEVLVKMAVAGSVPKKRRLPEFELSQEGAKNGSYDDHSITSKQEIGQVFQRDFRDKLRLELSAGGAQSSTEDQESPAARTETVELSDTGVSFCSKRSLLLSSSVFEEGEGLVPCHLNLTLASSSMQMGIQEQGPGNADEMIAAAKNQDAVRESDQGTAATITQSVAANGTGRVNDVFWEQFLTERPGSSETEEATSDLKVSANAEQQEGRREGSESTRRSKKDMGRLSL